MNEINTRTTGKERIAKFMAKCAFCSRRKAEEMIAQKLIYVNGTLITSPIAFVDQNDEIIIKQHNKNTILQTQEAKIWLYYKPTHIISSHKDSEGRETIFDRLKHITDQHIISVGRLDYMSEGLMILTNNREIATYLEHAKNQRQRTYRIMLKTNTTYHQHSHYLDYNYSDPKYDGHTLFTENHKRKLQNGIVVDSIQYKPIYAEIFNNNVHNNYVQTVELTLHEGKNREIRRIMEYFHLVILKLIRVQYDCFDIGKMQPDEIISVENNIVKTIQNQARESKSSSFRA